MSPPAEIEDSPTGSVAGHMEITYGCETCPERNKVVIPALGTLSITVKPPVPMSIAMELGVNQANEMADSHFRMPLATIVELNTKACEDAGSCPYNGAVAEIGRRASGDPEILEMILNPQMPELEVGE